MTVSMTGFASHKGTGLGYVWSWDLRSVNGKGLDLRLRVPDWIEGLEFALRSELQKALGRGNVALTLKVSREDGAEGALRLNSGVLPTVLHALREVEEAAMSAGVTLAQPTSADVLSMRGVLDVGSGADDTAPLRAAILAELPIVLSAFQAMRQAEGRALNGILVEQLDTITSLRAQAVEEAARRQDETKAALSDAVKKVLQNSEGVDEGRLMQELALIAVKTDVAEELDRLAAHVDAARGLLAADGPVGRKFDFLMQEFMREANTLCSKSQSLALTRIGLDLKTVIDQLREQIQNVE